MSGLRVCIVAENASTRMGGEAILPFHYFRLLRRRGVDAWLVVHERGRAELEQHFPHQLERIRFVADRPLQKLFFRAGKLLPRRVAEATFGLANQMLTQSAQRSVVRSLVTGHTVVHQPIPVSPRFPSLLGAEGAPLIIGPLNGGMEYPPAFRRAEPALSRAAIALGRSWSHAINALLPGKRRAAVVLVANERTRAALPGGLRGRVLTVPENAVVLDQWRPQPDSPQHQPPASRFLFMGRLVDWKALDIVLEALKQVPAASLDVIGDGPMLEPWRTFAQSHGVQARVRFLGWRTQPECALSLSESLALVLPSIYECGGAVVLEAMAMSRPVIATAWGGPLEYLDPCCGILVEPRSREALVEGFANAMRTLIESPALCRSLGSAGREKVEQHYDWERRIDAMLTLYQSVLPGAATP